jgi:hypothetical protein
MRFAASFVWLRKVLLLSVAVAAFSAAAAPPGDRTPLIAFEEKALRVSNLTPGGAVVLFVVSREATGYSTRTVELTQIHTSDASGIARIELKKPLALRSIVAVVDYETGSYAVVAPPGAPLRFTELPRSLLKKQNQDEFEQLAVGTDWIEALCVRPRKGVWRSMLVDGGAPDRDGSVDGGVLFNAAQMRRVYGSDESPSKFRPHDVLIIIDPKRVEVMGTEVKP